MKSPRLLGLLLVTVVAISALQAAYMASGVVPSTESQYLWSFGLALAFIVWVDSDASLRRKVPCHDFGFLVAVFFPVSLVWYAFWSRGWRGFYVLAGLFGLMLLPWLSALACWVMLHGFPS